MTAQRFEYATAAAVVFINLLIAVVIYLLFGWYFIRGYNEVVNFISVGLVNILATLNVASAAIAGGWCIISGRWKAAPRGRLLTIGCAVSSVLLFSSPLFVPTIGRFANHHGLLHTPLVEAARYGDAWLVASLVRGGANPNVKHNALGTTPLHYMAHQGSHAVVKLLLEKGADPNARQDYSLETPLHWAVKAPANLATIEILVEHGANPALKDSHGKTPLDYAETVPDPKGAAIYQIFRRRGKPRN